MPRFIIFTKKNLIIISVLIITAITTIICFGALSSKTVEGSPSKFKVVIDVGHGGVDGGVLGKTTNIKESELNLSLSKKLETLLISSGFSVTLTRKTDAGLYGMASKNLKRKDMEKRKSIIDNVNPDIVISIHMNYFSLSSRRGAQVFYKKSDSNGFELAKNIQNSFNLMQECVKQSSPLSGDYYILNCSNIPSVICECGFLSNIEDEKLLITDEYQHSIAYAIFKGIVNYSVSSTLNYNY